MSAPVGLLRGDGVGVELLDAAREVLEAIAPELSLEEAPIGFDCFRERGRALPDETLDLARRARACLLVAVGSPSTPTPGYRSPVVQLRRELDLYANLRPVRGLGLEPVDLLLVRENTEGLYAGRERRTAQGAIAERVVTRAASERIARVAAAQAAARRGRVTVVHKANVLRESCGVFREASLRELDRHPGIEVDEMLVDHAAYRLASEPAAFDVLVTTNLFGDILSDVAAHAGGGLGMVDAANVGERHALFEPVHGSAPTIAGQGIANPTATLRACAALLGHVGFREAGARLAGAIDESAASGPRTPDRGGAARTEDVLRDVLERAGVGSTSTAAGGAG